MQSNKNISHFSTSMRTDFYRTFNISQTYFKEQKLKNIKRIIFITFLFVIASCGVKEMKLDKSKWNERFDGIYENRENMVNDLIENHLNKGMSYKNIIDLLGEPGNYADLKPNEIVYEIMVDYGWNIDPMEGKDLYLEFGKDSTLTNSRLEHWEH